MNEFLFLYGTLLPELAPPALLRHLKRLSRVGRACVRGRLYDLGEFPGAVLDPSSDSWILGEIFRIPDDSILELLDAYEQFDAAKPEQSLFIRATAAAATTDGAVLDCWIYVYNREPGNAPLLPDGDYSQYAAGRRSPRHC